MPFSSALSQSMLLVFEMLIEEIEAILPSINKVGASAFEANDYDGAYRAIEHALILKAFHQDISSLKEEWGEFGEVLAVYQKQKTSPSTLVSSQINTGAAASKSHLINADTLPSSVDRLITGRIRKGLRTQEEAFFCPILRALSDLGGSAKRSKVFDILERSMKDVLRPIDYQTLSSACGQLRWQNSAQWARNLMVKEGLLRANSPQGIWEITEKGKAFLAKNSR